jgi:glutathione S-transferase
MGKPTVYHIPVCPFSQRLEILLALKNRRDDVNFQVVDITVPRPEWLVQKSGGRTAMPILETEGSVILYESLVLMRYLEDLFPEPITQRDPTRRAIENLFVSLEDAFVASGYRFVMNQDRATRQALHDKHLAEWAKLDAFLSAHAPGRTFLFEQFAWAEAVYTSMFMRFWFAEYYEGFDLPDSLSRVRRYRDACREHEAAQQVTREEIIKAYYDYAKGAGNGALLPGRTRSSFVFEPHWSKRPWPPADKFGVAATDAQLGLV